MALLLKRRCDRARGGWTASSSAIAPAISRAIRARDSVPARAGTRRFRLLSALRAHTTAPCKTELLREALRALNSPGRARTRQALGRVGGLAGAEGMPRHENGGPAGHRVVLD